jgi:hypothetical protein
MNLVSGANACHGRLLLLAPENAFIPETFESMESNRYDHSCTLASLQRLRGRAYFEDGAIDRSELEPDGRYVQDGDERAWHLVTVDGRGDVTGCARYIAHSRRVRFADTTVSGSSLTRSGEWASSFRKAVESEIELANLLGIDYVEVGGWALTPELRCSSEALRIALGMFSLARVLGGCIGLTTATQRHCSASILRRIGGQPLATHGVEIPSYYDPRYGCQMEVLRFNSATPNPRFEPWIEELRRHLSTVPVIRAKVYSDPYGRHASAHHSSGMTAA